MFGQAALAVLPLDKAGLLGTPFLPQDFHPKVLVQIDFPQTGASVQLGNELTPDQGQGDPVVSFVAAAQDPEEQQSTYCLLSFDPDAPSRENQEFGPWRHYVLGGLKPKSIEEISSAVESKGERGVANQGLVEQTESPISPWVAPSPGKGTGLHRYCFALYKQPRPLKPLEEQATIKSNERPDRRKFDVASFATDNELELVGFNFFLCQNP
ncbi:carboxypeptidase Y inhibitor [Microbotryomycetes sp. JL221]|nr:carboxypeptidase Y inhibitor [Microbotryomycetes sp. JL221]